MDKTALIFAFIVAAFLLGCQQNGMNVDEVDDPVPVEGKNFTFYNSESMYEHLSKTRSTEVSDPLEIADVWTTEQNDKKYLHVEAKHKKSCDDQFEAIWDGRIAESSPLQIFLFVRLNTAGCSDLEDFKTDTLSLDLYELISPDQNPLIDEAIFRVSNASSDQDVEYDASDSTSSE